MFTKYRTSRIIDRADATDDTPRTVMSRTSAMLKQTADTHNAEMLRLQRVIDDAQKLLRQHSISYEAITLALERLNNPTLPDLDFSELDFRPAPEADDIAPGTLMETTYVDGVRVERPVIGPDGQRIIEPFTADGNGPAPDDRPSAERAPWKYAETPNDAQPVPHIKLRGVAKKAVGSCPYCDGAGVIDSGKDCKNCVGTGLVGL